MTFNVTGKGTNCSYIGKETFRNQDLCKAAANSISKNFEGSGTYPNNPKGCFLNDNRVFWNTHKTGANSGACQAICSNKGKLHKGRLHST